MTAASPDRPRSRHNISIVGASRVYPNADRPAVDNVSLEIAGGEFMTFLGPSGSGKTTMLSMIAGFVQLSEGSIRIDGEDVTAQKPHKRNLGVVFQHYALFPHMTVAANIAYPLQQRGTSKAETARRVRSAMEMVHLQDFADRLPRQLSGGQQQRVALARAIVYEPRALLLDEPLGALDKRLRDQMQREIARMHKELGMTFVFVTHDQEEALTLSDHIAVFNNGRIEQVGTPTELYDRPQSLFVAKFLGESNVFDGQEAGTVSIVRPERIMLFDKADAAPPGSIRRPATVTDVAFVGNHFRIGLRFEQDGEGSAMQLASMPLGVEQGQHVTAAWHAESQRQVSRGMI